MHALVAHFSGRFEEWIRPADLLWLAAESDMYGAPWWILSRGRRDPAALVAEIRQWVSQAIEPSAPWHGVLVFDAEDVERDGGERLRGHLTTVLSVPNPPRQLTLLLVGSDAVLGRSSVTYDMPERAAEETAPADGNPADEAPIDPAVPGPVTGGGPASEPNLGQGAGPSPWSDFDQRLRDAVAAMAREGSLPTRLVVLAAPDLIALESVERKVLAANLLLLLARHPHAFPREFTAGRLVHHDPLLAGPNGSQVDLGALATAIQGMRGQVDAVLTAGPDDERVEIYPLPQPHLSTLPLYKPIESPKPLVTRMSPLPLRYPDATGFGRIAAWREQVALPAASALHAVHGAADAGERVALDALRVDATTQGAATADVGRNPDVRSVAMTRPELRAFAAAARERLAAASIAASDPDDDVPTRRDWEAAFADFRAAAASRATAPTALAVNALLLVGLWGLGAAFQGPLLTLTYAIVVLVALNLFALVPIVARVRFTAQRLEALRARVNAAIAAAWRRREAQALQRERYFVDAVNLRHVEAALTVSTSATLAGETSRAWIVEEFAPDLTRFVRSLPRERAALAARPFVPETLPGVPMPLQPLVHAHNYRPDAVPRPVTIRIDRGLDGGGRGIDVDPLLWSLRTVEVVTDLDETQRPQWLKRLRWYERNDLARERADAASDRDAP